MGDGPEPEIKGVFGACASARRPTSGAAGEVVARQVVRGLHAIKGRSLRGRIGVSCPYTPLASGGPVWSDAMVGSNFFSRTGAGATARLYPGTIPQHTCGALRPVTPAQVRLEIQQLTGRGGTAHGTNWRWDSWLPEHLAPSSASAAYTRSRRRSNPLLALMANWVGRSWR